MISRAGARRRSAFLPVPARPGFVRAAKDIGCTAHAGTPDYLKVIGPRRRDKAKRRLTCAAVGGGGALFPSLRAEYRGIATLQCYATADLGQHRLRGFSSDGSCMTDEGVIVEIVRPAPATPSHPARGGVPS
jgi:phenylacetate-CoA ligase